MIHEDVCGFDTVAGVSLTGVCDVERASSPFPGPITPKPPLRLLANTAAAPSKDAHGYSDSDPSVKLIAMEKYP